MKTLLLVMVLLAGCATPPAPSSRYLTEQQDRELREACEQPGGCMIIPYPLWEEIKRLLAPIVTVEV